MAMMPLSTMTAMPAHSSGAGCSLHMMSVAAVAKRIVEYERAPTTSVLPVRYARVMESCASVPKTATPTRIHQLSARIAWKVPVDSCHTAQMALATSPK